MGLSHIARGGDNQKDTGAKGRNGTMSVKPHKAHQVPVNLKIPAIAPKAEQGKPLSKVPHHKPV